jgi:hypothetical protein
VCCDGNFHHKHMQYAGEGISFHLPKHILAKSFVDQVGLRIAEARKAKPRSQKCKVPAEAVDDCERAYKAANGDKVTTSSAQFDDTDLMALVCRHDIPLFFANIDTPGEQQKYAVALLQYFFSLVPDHATTVALYDIGCVLDRSLEMVFLLISTCVSALNMLS